MPIVSIACDLGVLGHRRATGKGGLRELQGGQAIHPGSGKGD